MPAPICIVLTLEDRTLSELRVASNVPQRIGDRAHVLHLNAQGWVLLQRRKKGHLLGEPEVVKQLLPKI